MVPRARLGEGIAPFSGFLRRRNAAPKGAAFCRCMDAAEATPAGFSKPGPAILRNNGMPRKFS
ncbi:hypothetical protein, partial [uncultured Desulfovibrio sp.]|uniref:hypothetical protein n=1 Tax=uncultured Desulfovibrio sp. TaxID=167968 RepID=UPI00262DE609